MNKKKHFIWSLLFLVILLLAFATPVATFTGCSGNPTNKANQVATTTTVTVDAAMEGWGAYVRSGKATVEQRVKVRDAYMKYQNAMKVAETATLMSLTNAAAGTNGVPAVTLALNAASAASGDLIKLIESFMPKEQK